MSSHGGAGETLDATAIARLDAWLRSRVPALAGAPLPDVRQFPGGASNWTYLLRYPGHDLVLRRPPEGTKAKSAHDMGRESQILNRLAPYYPLVPETIALCSDPAVLGADFYVMRRIEGVILRRDPPAGLALSPETCRRLCRSFIDALVALHRIDPAAAGLADLGRGPDYARRQVAGWTDRYRKARTRNVPRADRLMTWLTAHAPHDVGSSVIHNDFRFDNMVLDPGDRSQPPRIVGVLDWEMATVGDPLMDLAGALAYWVEAADDPIFRALRRQPTHLPGMLTRREIVAEYCAAMGIQQPDWTFYELFGLFRLAAIAQQIYFRYHRRETRNPAFRHFWLYVHYLLRRCRRILKRQERLQ